MMVSLIIIGLFGLAVGSFLNVLILRTHGNKSWTKGRSHCPHCRHVLAWYDLIPVLSFVMLSGRCRYCKKAISAQYPLVELTTAILFALAYYAANGGVELWNLHAWDTVRTVEYLAVVCVMVMIFVYDLRWHLIPDRITIPAIICFFILNAILFPIGSLCNPISGVCTQIPGWTSYLLGAILGAGFFFTQYVISKGRWIGGGDIRLGGLMGVILGPLGVLLALFIAYCVGAFWGVGLILTEKKTMKSTIPFGTFLAASSLTVLFWYEGIRNFLMFYLGI